MHSFNELKVELQNVALINRGRAKKSGVQRKKRDTDTHTVRVVDIGMTTINENKFELYSILVKFNIYTFQLHATDAERFGFNRIFFSYSALRLKCIFAIVLIVVCCV